MAYLLAHWDDISGVLVALGAFIHALAVLIVNMTDTPKDGSPRGRPYRALELLAGIVTSKAKQ